MKYLFQHDESISSTVAVGSSGSGATVPSSSFVGDGVGSRLTLHNGAGVAKAIGMAIERFVLFDILATDVVVVSCS